MESSSPPGVASAAGKDSSTCPGESTWTPWATSTSQTGATTACQKFDQDGGFIDLFGESGDGNGQFNRPAGLAVDADGDVYVADLRNHRVQMFDREGRYLLKFLGDGTLSRQAREQALAGAMSLRLRAMATGELEAEKLFKGPYSLTVDSQGRMVVVDRDHHRVQIYQKDVIPLDESQIAPPLRAPVLGM